MWRRLKKVGLPLLVLFGVTFLLELCALATIENDYRKASNAEAAQLLGQAAAENPDLDAGEFLRTLRGTENSDALRRGQEILQRYGYRAQDLVAHSSTDFLQRLILLSLGSLAFLTLALLAYLYRQEHQRSNEIADLIDYIDQLSHHVYELRPQANCESDLSLLGNELYKITVLLKEAAEQNRQSRQNLETALADISHQLRTPLTSLSVTIDNIYDDPEMPMDLRQDFLRSASRQLASMSSLVTTLLNLAKFDSKTIKMHPQIVPIRQLLETAREKVEILADLHEITIVLQGDLTAEVELDQKWQAEALSNVLKNAIEHSPEHSRVEIDVEACSLFTKIKIRDFGEGIPPGEQGRIFERFYKAKNASPESVGIGLAFAKTVIEADRGQIRVKSGAEVGTEFTITYFRE